MKKIKIVLIIVHSIVVQMYANKIKMADIVQVKRFEKPFAKIQFTNKDLDDIQTLCDQGQNFILKLSKSNTIDWQYFEKSLQQFLKSNIIDKSIIVHPRSGKTIVSLSAKNKYAFVASCLVTFYQRQHKPFSKL